MSIEVIRLLQLAVQRSKAANVIIRVNDEVAAYLNNKKRREIIDLEEDSQLTVQILGSESHFPEHLEIEARDASGKVINLML